MRTFIFRHPSIRRASAGFVTAAIAWLGLVAGAEARVFAVAPMGDADVLAFRLSDEAQGVCLMEPGWRNAYFATAITGALLRSCWKRQGDWVTVCPQGELRINHQGCIRGLVRGFYDRDALPALRPAHFPD